MDTKKDIATREDIEMLMRSFYNDVLQDEVLKHIFIDVAKMDLEAHLPTIIDFWETILLDNHVYKKNAMQVHYELNKKIPLLPEHFERWLLLFNKSLNKYFAGRNVDLAKKRAVGIAQLMQHKMSEQNNKNNIPL